MGKSQKTIVLDSEAGKVHLLACQTSHVHAAALLRPAFLLVVKRVMVT